MGLQEHSLEVEQNLRRQLQESRDRAQVLESRLRELESEAVEAAEAIPEKRRTHFCHQRGEEVALVMELESLLKRRELVHRAETTCLAQRLHEQEAALQKSNGELQNCARELRQLRKRCLSMEAALDAENRRCSAADYELGESSAKARDLEEDVQQLVLKLSAEKAQTFRLTTFLRLLFSLSFLLLLVVVAPTGDHRQCLCTPIELSSRFLRPAEMRSYVSPLPGFTIGTPGSHADHVHLLPLQQKAGQESESLDPSSTMPNTLIVSPKQSLPARIRLKILEWPGVKLLLHAWQATRSDGPPQEDVEERPFLGKFNERMFFIVCVFTFTYNDLKSSDTERKYMRLFFRML